MSSPGQDRPEQRFGVYPGYTGGRPGPEPAPPAEEHQVRGTRSAPHEPPNGTEHVTHEGIVIAQGPSPSPRSHLGGRRLIGIGISLAAVVTVVVTAVTLLAGNDSAPSQAQLVAPYPTPPSNSVVISLDDFVHGAPDPADRPPTDEPNHINTNIGILDSDEANEELIVFGERSYSGTFADSSPYAAAVARFDRSGHVLWSVQASDVWDTRHGAMACTMASTTILCVHGSDEADHTTDIAVIDPDDGRYTTTTMAMDTGPYGTSAITTIGDDILGWTSRGFTATASRVDATTGEVKWTTDPLMESSGFLGSGYVIGDYLVIYEANTPADGGADTSDYSAPIDPALVKTDLVDPDTGEIISHLDGQLTSVNGEQWFSYSAMSSLHGEGVTAVDTNGRTLWNHSPGTLLGIPTSRDGAAIIGTPDNDTTGVTAVDPVSGSERWQATVPGNMSQAIQIGNTLMLSGGSGLILLDLTTGETINDASGLFAGSDGTSVYTYQPSLQELASYDLASGNQNWRMNVQSVAGTLSDGTFMMPFGPLLTIREFGPPARLAVLFPN